MKDNTLSKLGGTCSILLGISYIVVGIAYLTQPAALRGGGGTSQFLTTFAQNPTMHLVQHWAFALGAVLALAAVPAISDAVRSVNSGWVRWATNMAYLGFAVTAISNFRAPTIESQQAAAFAGSDVSLQRVIVATASPIGLDPQGWLVFGGVGLWILAVSLLALRGGTLPKPLAYLGIALAILYWFVLAGQVLQIETLIAIAAGLGGVIAAPIWYIWLGLRLRRASE